jgi:hypothetical protein
MVAPHRRFGTTYHSNLLLGLLTIEGVTERFVETSVQNYQLPLRNFLAKHPRCVLIQLLYEVIKYSLTQLY